MRIDRSYFVMVNSGWECFNRSGAHALAGNIGFFRSLFCACSPSVSDDWGIWW